MQKLLLVLSASLLAGCFAQQTWAQSDTASGQSDATAAIQKADKARNAAIVKADAAALDATTADTYVFTDPTGRVTMKKELMEDFGKGAIKIQSQELRDVKVHVYGNTAVETGEIMSKGTRDGKDTSGTFRFTRVWVNRNGTWQTVAFQETRRQ
jgi:ketosteroid isomerase-like protein